MGSNHPLEAQGIRSAREVAQTKVDIACKTLRKT